MKFLTIITFLTILILPFLLFLLVLNFVVFGNLFYKEKFLEYGVQEDIPEAVLLHEKIINFVKGRDKRLPNEFNEREKQHLLDVKRAIRNSTIMLYFLAFLFGLLLLISAFALKNKDKIMNFAGKVLVFGGFLTIMLAAALSFSIASDFSATFESFHGLFFERGTYIFNPAKDVIVRLYPEQLFMDLGLRISKGVVLASAATILVGGFLILKSKNKKN